MTAEGKLTVETALGRVIGSVRGDVQVYRGIPYARAPVGALRWMPPMAAPAYESAHDGSAVSCVAPQNPSRLRGVIGDVDLPQSEDCLRLTIHAPAQSSGKLPVFVWVHGGAWLAGGGDLPLYSGEKLAALGIVVVTLNYRLGALGFLAHPAIGPGNLGLRDQLCALEWIQRNIAAFGGDPQNVTLAGQSAGAWSIPIYAANGVTRRLFHRAIMQSAPLGIEPLSPDSALKNAEFFLSRLGVKPEQSDLLECLRDVPLSSILAAQQETAIWYASWAPRPAVSAIAFRPVAEANFVPGGPEYQRLLLSPAAAIDCIVGYTRDEMTAFSGPAALNDSKAEAECDSVFAEPALRWGSSVAAAGRDAFVYRFDWSARESGFGACHCLDLPFVFGTAASVASTQMLHRAERHATERLSSQVRATWAAFVRTGKPEAMAGCTWPRFTATNGRSLIIDDPCRVQA